MAIQMKKLGAVTRPAYCHNPKVAPAQLIEKMAAAWFGFNSAGESQKGPEKLFQTKPPPKLGGNGPNGYRTPAANPGGLQGAQ